jgi:hypothetical protein
MPGTAGYFAIVIEIRFIASLKTPFKFSADIRRAQPGAGL